MSEYKKQLISTEAKVGFFSAAILIVLIFVSIKLTGWKWTEKKGYYLYAYFDNVQGLSKESPVMIAGIKIGKIVNIVLVNDKARVKMKIFSNVKIKRDAEAIIRTRGILGEKYIEIKNSGPNNVFLRDGETIKYTLSPPDFEKMINELSEITVKLGEITNSLAAALGGKKNQLKLKDIVSNIQLSTRNFRELTASLKYEIKKLDRKISPGIDNIDQVVKLIRKKLPGMIARYNTMMDHLNVVVKKGSSNINTSLADLKQAIADIAPAIRDIKKILKRLEKGKGTIGKLLTDETTINKLNSSLNKIDNMLTTVDKLTVKIDYQGEYQLKRDEGWKSYLNFSLIPNKKKSYIFGVVSDPMGSSTWKEEEIITNSDGTVTKKVTRENIREDKYRFNLEYARHFGPLTIRGGIIQNTGGLGVDYSLLNNHLQFSIEAFNFSKETNPYLRGRIAFWPWRYFYVVGGSNDFINYKETPIYFFGAGISFTDSDLKYVFSFMPSVGQ